jgi:hypothetical protein
LVIYASSKEGRKTFFFEKKNQKTFGPGGGCTGVAKSPRSRRFLLLLFKKEALALLGARGSDSWIASPHSQ